MQPTAGRKHDSFHIATLYAVLLLLEHQAFKTMLKPMGLLLYFLCPTKETHFWGPRHSQKCMKICTHIKTSEKRDIWGEWHMCMPKWLNSAP